MKSIYVKQYLSPCGVLLLGDYNGKLCLCDWLVANHRNAVDSRLKRLLNAFYVEDTTCLIEQAGCQLGEYFAGNRREFDIPLLAAGTDFQKKIWEQLMSIGYGETVSYSDVAMAVGLDSGARAVAAAVGANALSIFVPCHRVVGKSGSLTGYAGGLDAKNYLLAIEKSQGQ